MSGYTPISYFDMGRRKGARDRAGRGLSLALQLGSGGQDFRGADRAMADQRRREEEAKRQNAAALFGRRQEREEERGYALQDDARNFEQQKELTRLSASLRPATIPQTPEDLARKLEYETALAAAKNPFAVGLIEKRGEESRKTASQKDASAAARAKANQDRYDERVRITFAERGQGSGTKGPDLRPREGDGEDPE